MTVTRYTINEFCDLFEMSRQYFYKLVSTGRAPVLSGNGRHPIIALEDALYFAEDRVASVAESYRARWQAGIRRVKIDMVLAKNAQDMEAAQARTLRRKVEKEEAARALAVQEERLRQRGLPPIPDIYDRRMKPIDAVALPTLVLSHPSDRSR
jgi:hypothetical protein